MIAQDGQIDQHTDLSMPRYNHPNCNRRTKLRMVGQNIETLTNNYHNRLYYLILRKTIGLQQEEKDYFHWLQ